MHILRYQHVTTQRTEFLPGHWPVSDSAEGCGGDRDACSMTLQTDAMITDRLDCAATVSAPQLWHVPVTVRQASRLVALVQWPDVCRDE
jgi:hypothetical protein